MKGVYNGYGLARNGLQPYKFYLCSKSKKIIVKVIKFVLKVLTANSLVVIVLFSS